MWTMQISALNWKSDLYIPRNETVRPSFPIPTFMYLWAIYIFPGSWAYINRSQIHECEIWETEQYNSVLEITRPHSFISGNTSIRTRHVSHSHRTFICSDNYLHKHMNCLWGPIPFGFLFAYYYRLKVQILFCVILFLYMIFLAIFLVCRRIN